MMQTLQAAYQYARQNDAVTIWAAVIRKDTHPFIQFIKYGVFGVAAVIVYQLTFGILGHTVFPHFGGNSPQHQVYFVLASAVGFLFADVFAYVANILWVFQGGKHRRLIEFLLFTGVSSIGWIVGMIPALLAFRAEQAGSWVASLIVTITSVIVNYLCRKLIIFRN